MNTHPELAAIVFDPVSPHVQFAPYIALTGIAIYALWHWRKSRSTLPRWVQPILALIVLAGLYGALLRPSLSSNPTPDEWSVVFLLDRSESTQRGSAPGKKLLAEWVDEFAREIPAGSKGFFSIIAFGGNAKTISSSLPIKRLARAIDVGDPDGIDTGATNIALALEAVHGGLSNARPTTVVLASDGLTTSGDALAVAKHLGRRGVPVHVLGSETEASGIGVVAANLPAEVHRGSETTTRAVIANPLDNPVDFTTRLTVDGEPGEADTYRLRAGARASMREPLTFDKGGIHFVDLQLEDAQGRRQRRSFFTWVTAPANVTIVGGQGMWKRGLDPDRYTVVGATPGGELTLDDQDIVIIDGVAKEDLGTEQVKQIAAAARRGDLGVLLVNGDHPGPDTSKTVAMSYEGSTLDPLLPTASKPRPKKPDPPPMEIIVIIDSSGSMGGWKLTKARQIATRIIRQMRAKDLLRLIEFRDTAKTLAEMNMTPPNKNKAVGLLPVTAEGGTDPTEAVQRITQSGRCGVFFISDIEFEETLNSPSCATTIFDVGGRGNLAGVRQFGEIHLVSQNFNANKVRLGFFEEKPRRKYFERGEYRPQWSLTPGLINARLPLSGNAIGFPRDGARVLFSRSFPNDPVLAYTAPEKARVASFLSALPETWTENDQARRAIDQWMRRLLDWSERERYWIEASLVGSRVGISITAYLPDGTAVGLTGVELSLEFSNGKAEGVRTSTTDHRTYTGSVRLPDEAGSGWGRLIVRESGSSAVSQEQKIPFFVPPLKKGGGNATTQESWSAGIDEDLLSEIAHVTQGLYQPEPEQVKPWRDDRPGQRWPLWMPLIMLAASVFVVLVFLDRNYS